MPYHITAQLNWGKSKGFYNFALNFALVTVSFLFFKVGGSVLIVSNALKLLSALTKCECDDKIADFLTPLLDAAYFIVCIYGSVIVFGK